MAMGSTEKSATVDAIISTLEGDTNFSTDLAADAPALKKMIQVIIDEMTALITDHAETSSTLTTSLNDVFSAGVPAPPDGGAALQSAWITSTLGGIADASEGTVA